MLAARGLETFGLGGAACRAAGVELTADLRSLSAMGATHVLSRALAIARAYGGLLAATRARSPRAALLVDYAEFNARLGRSLRARGVRVVRCVAPQVWAWRPGRLGTAARSFDRLAVVLPFEEALWRAHGVDARYVGHPAVERAITPRPAARATLGAHDAAVCVAIVAGSRAHEVRHNLPALLAAHARLARSHGSEAHVLLAPSLDAATLAWARQRARDAEVACVEVDAGVGLSAFLAAFDLALVASGTATLECALAGLPMVVVYRTDPLTQLAARALLRTPFVALPSIVLGRSAVAELLGAAATPTAIAQAGAAALDDASGARAIAVELHARLAPPHGGTFAERVADLVTESWT